MRKSGKTNDQVIAPEWDGLARQLGAVPGLAIVGFGPEGTITLFNQGAEKLFGYRAASLVGQAGFQVLHDCEEVRRLFDAGAEPAAIHFEDEVPTRLGDRIAVDVTFLPAGEGNPGAAWLAVYRDRTPLQRAQCQLSQHHEPAAGCESHSEKEAQFLRELLGRTMESIQIGLAVQEMDSGLIAYANEGFEEITGLRHLNIMGETFDSVLEKWTAARNCFTGYMNDLEKCWKAEGRLPASRHCELELPTGKKTLEIYGRPIVLEGHPSQYLLLIVEDHTDKHRLRMQLVQSEKLAAVGQLAAGIAHELRNPLNTIFNALYDLNEILQPRPRDVEEDIEVCMDEIKRVQEIINNLLDFAREGERSTGRTNLNDVLEKTLRLVQHDLTNKGIQITTDLLPELPDVAINGNALKQILINVITNATQAMSEGGRLTLKTCKGSGPVPQGGGAKPVENAGGDASRLRLAGPLKSAPTAGTPPGDAKEHVMLMISDTGPGIPAENLAHVFNPFFTTKEPGSGTGLGLSVVHSLVRDAHGAIAVESAPGQGSTFTIELPAAAD